MRLIKIKESILTLLSRSSAILYILIASFTISAQNQDSLPREGFADYLYQMKLYDFAAEEYERLVYQFPNESSYFEKLIAAYRHSDKPLNIETRLHNLDKHPELLVPYCKLLITNNHTGEAKEIIRKYDREIEGRQLKKELELNLALAEYRWHNAIELYNSDQNTLEDYSALIRSVENRKYKNPRIAALLSTVIPGSGRVYAKDTTDGIISFIFIAGAAFQAYRRFKQNGISSIGGWIYGGFALGFHVSNIYGSFQSAKSYNHKIDSYLYDQSIRHINADMQ